jgi:glycine cleavage system transcriptional repressor
VVHVTGADRVGIVAQVTGALAEQGFNILDLESDVIGSEHEPVYLMNILGVAECPLEDLEQAVDGLRRQGIEVSISPIETMIG